MKLSQEKVLISSPIYFSFSKSSYKYRQKISKQSMKTIKGLLKERLFTHKYM